MPEQVAVVFENFTVIFEVDHEMIVGSATGSMVSSSHPFCCKTLQKFSHWLRAFTRSTVRADDMYGFF